MYKYRNEQHKLLRINKHYVGERLEQKVNRIVNNKEPIKDGAPIIYQDRADGVLPDHDIRTDRFEHAVEAMDKVTKTEYAKRKARAEGRKVEKDPKKEETKQDGGPEPIQGTKE